MLTNSTKFQNKSAVPTFFKVKSFISNYLKKKKKKIVIYIWNKRSDRRCKKKQGIFSEAEGI